MAGKNRGRGDDSFDERDERDEVEAVDEFEDLDESDEEFDESDESDEDVDETDETASRRSRTRVSSRSKATVATRAKDDTQRSYLGRIPMFVREVVAELQKVIWPTRKELLTYTAVVLVFVTIMMSFVGLLDQAFARGLLFIFGSDSE